MAISNELSSEIATALLSSGENSSLPLEDRKRVVEEVRETLEQMDDENRKPKARIAAASGTPLQKLD